LFELLTKDPPFSADSPLALLAAVVSDPLPSIRDKRPDVPPELEDVIAKCLEKNPDHRYQTVAELAEALAPFAPRSQPSISRISGILRATSLRPPATDKSPSSERTLQSPVGRSTPHPISEQPTEEVKVKVITPAPPARSEKSTRTEWEATPSEAGRSRKRVIAIVLGAAAIVVALVLWQRREAAPSEVLPDPGTVRAGGTATVVEAPAIPTAPGATSAESTPSVAPLSPPPPASSEAAPPEVEAIKITKSKQKNAAPVAPPVVASAKPSVPAPAVTTPKTQADPLDGRR
jgi:serine/threonine-protein kinase